MFHLDSSTASASERYVAYAFGLCFSYLAQLFEGRDFSALQGFSCFGIALLAVAA